MKSKQIFLIISLLFYFCNTKLQINNIFKNSAKYPSINIVQSNNDLSIFNLQNTKSIFKEVKNGGNRGENEIVMYDSENYSPTNVYGYEAQINENFEVVSLNTNVEMLDNGYIISGHSLGNTKIKENIKIGDYVIFIKEINTAYIFEGKQEYKYAYYTFKINSYLQSLNEKMIKNNLYDELYNKLVYFNDKYKFYLENNNEDLISFHSEIKEIYDKYINSKEKIDLIKLTYSNIINLVPFEYKEIYSNENSVKPQNNIYNLTVTKECGYRNQDKLVKYDKSCISERNKYGYEFAVDSKGNVVNQGITVDLPENGYILSGHGKNKDLIYAQLKIGDYLVYDNLIVSIYRDTNINIINSLGKQIQSLIEKYNKLYDNKTPLYYEEIGKKLNILISYYNSIDKSKIFYDIKSYFGLKIFDYESLILEIKFLFLESNPVQIQAMWHTPNSLFDESNVKGVKQFLKTCSECGFNRIYLETNSVGTAYYHSDILISHKILGKKYGEYKDYLECFVEEAHKLNIEIVTWVQVLRARATSGSSLAQCYKEEWLSVDYNGNKCTFLDSTNPEVHQFLISQFSELTYIPE